MSRFTEYGINGEEIQGLAENTELSQGSQADTLTTLIAGQPVRHPSGSPRDKQGSTKCVPLLATKALSPDSVTRVTLENGHALAVYRLGDEYFVSDDVCTHGEASLAEGDIEDGTIVCPYHEGSFDIRTGEARAYPCLTPLKVYPVQIQSDMVCVQMDEADAALSPDM